MITLDGSFQLKRKRVKNQKDLVPQGVLAPSKNELSLWGDTSEVEKYKKVENNCKDVSTDHIVVSVSSSFAKFAEFIVSFGGRRRW